MRCRVVALAVVGLAVRLPAAWSGYTFTTLDDPDAARGRTFARGINDAGAVVGYYTASNFVQHGFIYQNGTYTTVDVPGARATTIYGVNNVGQVVGSYSNTAGTHGFILSGSALTTIDYPNTSSGTTVLGINDAGTVVGDAYLNGVFRGFSVKGPTFTPIDVPGALGGDFAGTFPNGINNSGRIVGSSTGSAIGTHGFRLDGTAFTPIDVPGATATSALGINAPGSVVGYYRGGGTHGFVDIGGSFTTIDDPHAVLATMATGINASGAIVGTYLDAGALGHGFLAVPTAVPEPGSAWLAALGGLGLLGYARRRVRAGRAAVIRPS